MEYQILGILNDVLGDSKQYSKGEFYYYCPLCNHYKKKLAVNIIKKKWHCWKCSQSGNSIGSLLWKVGADREQITALSELLNDYIPKEINDTKKTTNIELPKEYIPLYENKNSIEYNKAKSYILSRGLTELDIECYQIGYCETGEYYHRIIVPSFSCNNKLNYFVARSYDSKLFSFRQPQISKNIIGLENHIYWGYNHIILTEGIFDAMSIKRNVIPLFGKYIPKKLREKIINEKVKDVYICLDNDARSDTIRIASKLMKENINIRIIHLNKKDPSEIGFEGMNDLIENAELLTFTDLISLKLTA